MPNQAGFLLPRQFVESGWSSAQSWPTERAEEYTRWLARSHYENFHVVTFLLPRRLHQDFYNVYAFCRWADDLGDEMNNAEESLRLLDWWQLELDAMYRGQTRHPVFVALEKTVTRHQLPKEPFAHLIQAFRQDQTIKRYQSWDQLFGYCRYSANPVGRLVLMLCGYRDAGLFALSDATCTALQLANFWQDVSIDLAKDRVYLPLELLDRHGCTVEQLFARREDDHFRRAMREAVAVARQLFHQGLPLARQVQRRLALDLTLFSLGGLKILNKIESINYSVLSQRPAISTTERAMLLLRTLPAIFLRAA